MSQGISVQSTILHFRPTRRLQIAKGNCQILFMYVRLRNPSITLCTASLGDKLKNLKTDREKSWDVQTTKWGNKTTPPPDPSGHMLGDKAGKATNCWTSFRLGATISIPHYPSKPCCKT